VPKVLNCFIGRTLIGARWNRLPDIIGNRVYSRRSPDSVVSLPTYSAIADDMILPSLERLSDAFPNTDIWLCINLAGWTCFVGEPHTISVCGATILEIVAQLISG
jgi:hypothetical protein